MTSTQKEIRLTTRIYGLAGSGKTNNVAITMAVRELSDAELIIGARKGDADSYGELYRRHVDSARSAARALTRSRSDADDVASEAFARVLRALQSGGGPDVSFRPYLVTAVRNVFYDKVRRNREEPSEDMSDEVNVALLDAANSQEDGAFAAAAFASLPERWQLVLWHTEVEGRSVSEVAPLLGLAPNAVAALAYRAREGLRQAYLQAHLRDQKADGCRDCASNLGAYVRDGLSARDRRRVDAHLAGCVTCAALVVELADTNNTLRAALVPALIGVSSSAYLAGLGGKGVLGLFTRLPKRQQVAAGSAAAAAVLVLLALLAGAFASEPSPVASIVSTTVAAGEGGGGGGGGGGQTPAPVPPDTVPPTATTTATTTAPVSTQPVGQAPPTARPRTFTTVPNGPTTVVPTTAVPTTTVPAVPTTTVPPPPPSLLATAVQKSAALVNGQVRIQITLANNGGSVANGIELSVPAPAGSSFVRAERQPARRAAVVVAASGSGWACNAAASCTLPSLAVGQSSVLLLTFAISPSAPSSITLTPTISKPVGAVIDAPPITVPVGTVNGLLAAETERGTVVAIGNSVTSCTDTDPDCPDARNGLGSRLNHNDFAMQHVNTAAGAFNSSSAVLSLSGTVSRAFLVWGGDVVQGLPPALNAPARGTVTFGTPAGVTTVTADALQDNSGDTYFAYAEVTSLVTGSGTYSVADIQTALGTSGFGGWSLVVIEHNSSLPERFLMVTAPLDVVTTGTSSTFSVGLFSPMVDTNAALVVAGFEGERTLIGDNVSLSGFVVNNVFSGRAPGTRNPAFDNLLGTDVMVAAATGLNGPTLQFDATTTNDRIMVALVAVALDL